MSTLKKSTSLKSLGLSGSPRPRDDNSSRLNNELLAENNDLKARIHSLTEELRTTREICAKTHKYRRTPVRSTSPGGVSPLGTNAMHGSGGGGSRSRSPRGEVVAFVPFDDASTQTKAKTVSSVGIQTADMSGEQGSDEVRRLKAEVLRSHAECASLQHALQLLRRSVAGEEKDSASVNEAVDYTKKQQDEKIQQLNNLLLKANEEIKARETELRMMTIEAAKPMAERERKRATYDKSINTDDPLLNVSFPSKGGPAPSTTEQRLRDELVSTQRAHDLVASQLRQVRADLAAAQKISTTATAVGPVTKSTENVGVGVDVLYDYEKLFKLYRRSFTPASVESLLIEAENATERKAAEDSMKAARLAAMESETVMELKQSLEAARKDLIEAHEKIDELHYALDLERRERVQSSQLGGSESLAAKQAAAEISFLCDTLAATRSELELLQRRTTDAEAERDAAVASFSDLKARTQAMFEGCQDIAETTRREADEAIGNLASTVRQKDHEVNTLRGQIAALHRTLEATQQSRDAIRKEAEGFKTRVTALTSSIARLREDYNSQSVALREARAFAASFSNLSLQTPRQESGGPGSPPPAQAHVEGKLRASPSPTRKEGAKPRKASKDREAGSTSLQALDAALKKADKSPSARREDSKEKDSTGDSSLRDEYEELRSCFLLLVPLVPQAETAREVATGLCSGVEKLNERIVSLEKELKKKTVLLQNTKKDLVAAQEQITAMEKKMALIDDLTKKLDVKEKVAEKAKRQSELSKAEADQARQDCEARIRVLEVELEATRGALAQARTELAEGRDMMMRLLHEDENALRDER